VGTSSRPFTDFKQSNYDCLTRLKWRWFASGGISNNQASLETDKGSVKYRLQDIIDNYQEIMILIEQKALYNYYDIELL
jgi:hypothetical protein